MLKLEGSNQAQVALESFDQCTASDDHSEVDSCLLPHSGRSARAVIYGEFAMFCTAECSNPVSGFKGALRRDRHSIGRGIISIPHHKVLTVAMTDRWLNGRKRALRRRAYHCFFLPVPRPTKRARLWWRRVKAHINVTHVAIRMCLTT